MNNWCHQHYLSKSETKHISRHIADFDVCRGKSWKSKTKTPALMDCFTSTQSGRRNFQVWKLDQSKDLLRRGGMILKQLRCKQHPSLQVLLSFLKPI